MRDEVIHARVQSDVKKEAEQLAACKAIDKLKLEK